MEPKRSVVSSGSRLVQVACVALALAGLAYPVYALDYNVNVLENGDFASGTLAEPGVGDGTESWVPYGDCDNVVSVSTTDGIDGSACLAYGPLGWVANAGNCGGLSDWGRGQLDFVIDDYVADGVPSVTFKGQYNADNMLTDETVYICALFYGGGGYGLAYKSVPGGTSDGWQSFAVTVNIPTSGLTEGVNLVIGAMAAGPGTTLVSADGPFLFDDLELYPHGVGVGGTEGEGEGDWSGPGVPVGGAIALGLSALVCVLGGAAVLRKKS